MERDEYIAGLRQLADLLEENADLKLPYHGQDNSSRIWVFTHNKEDLKMWARALPGNFDKIFDDEDIILSGTIGGLHMMIRGNREGVCERVVVGKHEVQVPATATVYGHPARVEVVEDVEWICGSLLED